MFCFPFPASLLLLPFSCFPSPESRIPRAQAPGRRKAAVARVRVKPGEGKFLVNDKEVDVFFTEPQHQAACRKPLNAAQVGSKIDVLVNVHGGGITGQAEAILLGLARALCDYDPSLEQNLRDHGYLSRDPRKVERKKYGQRGARRRFQFSKR